MFENHTDEQLEDALMTCYELTSIVHTDDAKYSALVKIDEIRKEQEKRAKKGKK